MASTVRRWSTALAAAAAVALGAAALGVAAPAAATVPVYPGVTSDNVTFMGNFPDTLMISAEFALTGDFFYTSSLDSVSAWSYEIDGDDITVTLEGTLPGLTFENESMTYGERRNAAGEVTDRFVIVAEDLYHVDPTGSVDPHVGGGNVVIIDVTDPTAPFVRSQGEISTSTHTVQCLSRRDCEFAYAVGGDGVFSIVDLRDLDNPTEIEATGPDTTDDGHPRSPAAGPNEVFTTGAGHYWDIDEAGIAWHTGSGGAAAFDVTAPRSPLILNATDPTGTESPHNDFILHNSMRPNATAFDGDRADGNQPSLAKGNVLLVTEEDYANEGDEIICENAGEFSTWHVDSLDRDAYLAGTDEPFTPDNGSITFLSGFHPVRDGEGSPTATPADPFCSAHWFDYHQTGVIAQGYYAGGLYLIDVRDPMALSTYGYATTDPSEVWDAYWFPQRDGNGIDTGLNTNFVMTADNVRGVDVFRVALPEQVIAPDTDPSADPGGADDGAAAGSDGATTTDGSAGTAQDDSDRGGGLAATGGGAVLGAALAAAAAVALRRRRRGS